MVGFSNSGEEAYNVSAIQGSLHSAAQWNLWVQNFTLSVRLRRYRALTGGKLFPFALKAQDDLLTLTSPAKPASTASQTDCLSPCSCKTCH